MHKDFIIYKATNTVNGNFYIGATSAGIDHRKKSHLWDALAGRVGCKVLHRAIQKYGPEVFTWEIIAVLDSFKEMMAKEVELIAELKPQYNMTTGGEGVIGLPRTKEWYAKVSKTLKAKGIRPPGLTDWSFAHKSVVCLNDNKFFKSVKAARAYYNISDISGIFRGEQHSVGGLYFRFSKHELSVEECGKYLIESELNEFESAASRSKSRWRAVICINDNKEFSSIAKASRFYSIDCVSIRNSCTKGAILKGYLKFKYAESKEVIKFFDTPEGKASHRQKISEARKKKPSGKAVFAFETGEYFDNIISITKKYNVHPTLIYDYISRGVPCPRTGLTFIPVHN